MVTIQLPIYNEMYVVDRLIESVLAMDYPRRPASRSRCSTTRPTRRARLPSWPSAAHAAQGFDIKYIHRVDRTGYKAGALDAGLKVARGEFVAIFDADFVAPADFLRRTVPHFADPKVGMVQARWGHINRDYSLLTRVQAIMLDGHFVLEHGSRNRAGCFFNFNGTAGIWRTRRHRRRRRLAARHADRGPRPLATAPSCAAGSSCSCRTSSRRRNCRSR